MSALPECVDNHVVAAVRHVRVADYSLRAAAFHLDEGGFTCAAVNSLSAGTSMLLATWAGRRVPDEPEQMPPAFVAAAIEWRRQNGRAY